VHGRKRKIRRLGRHAAPSQIEKAAKQAGKAAPAVAVLGALAAATHAHDLVRPPATAAAGSVATIAQLSSGQRAVAATGLPASLKSRAFRHRQVPHPADSAAADGGDSPAAGRSAAGSGGTSPAPARQQADTGSAGGTAKCTGGGGPLPANYATIVGFLLDHGYSHNAVAGIAGNIYQESGGNPESVGSGGGGLIGWTPLPPGFVTGNSAADLHKQLAQILVFNQGWSQYLPALNAAGSPAEAADIYVTDFERAGIPAASNREAAATAVAAACGL
jgi:hypothetical protein